MRKVALAIAGCAVLAGCLTASYTPVRRYTLDPKIEVAKATTSTERTLGVRDLDAARAYGVAICFREEGLVLGSYTEAEWAEPPTDTLTRALLDALAATGRFKDVGNAIHLAQPDLILTGELRKFDQVRTADPWVAECEVRLELRESLGPEALWAATLSASEPLADRSPSSLAQAMSKAISRIANEAATTISTLPNTGQ